MLLFMTACYYDCNNENVFWVTLGDYNGNGMFLTIHNLNFLVYLIAFIFMA